jgi:hypothetical protein
MANGVRRVVSQHLHPPWVRLLCVLAPFTVEGARLYALLQWCLLAEVFNELC